MKQGNIAQTKRYRPISESATLYRYKLVHTKNITGTITAEQSTLAAIKFLLFSLIGN